MQWMTYHSFYGIDQTQYTSGNTGRYWVGLYQYVSLTECDRLYIVQAAYRHTVDSPAGVPADNFAGIVRYAHHQTCQARAGQVYHNQFVYVVFKLAYNTVQTVHPLPMTA